jgi:hypothetical protein
MAGKHVSPEFAKRLRAEVRLFIQETKDGCVDCQQVMRATRDKYATCNEHHKVFYDLALHPRKIIQLRREGNRILGGPVAPPAEPSRARRPPKPADSSVQVTRPEPEESDD